MQIEEIFKRNHSKMVFRVEKITEAAATEKLVELLKEKLVAA